MGCCQSHAPLSHSVSKDDSKTQIKCYRVVDLRTLAHQLDNCHATTQHSIYLTCYNALLRVAPVYSNCDMDRYELVEDAPFAASFGEITRAKTITSVAMAPPQMSRTSQMASRATPRRPSTSRRQAAHTRAPSPHVRALSPRARALAPTRARAPAHVPANAPDRTHSTTPAHTRADSLRACVQSPRAANHAERELLFTSNPLLEFASRAVAPAILLRDEPYYHATATLSQYLALPDLHAQHRVLFASDWIIQTCLEVAKRVAPTFHIHSQNYDWRPDA